MKLSNDDLAFVIEKHVKSSYFNILMETTAVNEFVDGVREGRLEMGFAD